MSAVGTALRSAEQSALAGGCCDQFDVARGDVYQRFVDHAQRCGTVTGGHHNLNFLTPLRYDLAVQLDHLPGSPVKVRVPVPDALKVVPRTWQDESQILAALRGRVANVPACLTQRRRSSVHAYVEGVTLSAICPPGNRVDGPYVQALAELFAELALVPREALPRLPLRWPKNGDSRGYLGCLAELTEAKVRRPNWHRFGSLFTALGVPADTMRVFARQVPELQRRPFTLLHTDLHRDNLVVTTAGSTGPLAFLDWELASFGDPLHELATHLVRMHYPADQRAEVIEAWRSAMLGVRPGAVAGLEADLPHYIAFEHAQSVYPDIMRAAISLVGDLDLKGIDAAVGAVRSALRKAQEPLGLRPVDDKGEIRAALVDWSRGRQRTGGRMLPSWRRTLGLLGK